MSRIIGLQGVVLGLLLTGAVAAQSGGGVSGISVVGFAEHQIQADRVTVRLALESRAELAADALSKSGALAKSLKEKISSDECVVEAITSRGIKMSIEPVGGNDPMMGNMIIMGGESPEPPDLETVARETLEIVLAAAEGKRLEDQVVKILTTARELNVVPIGQGGSGDHRSPFSFVTLAATPESTTNTPMGVQYWSSASGQARDKAMESAFKDALEKANKVAKITGTRVGPILSVKLVPTIDPSQGETSSLTAAVKAEVRYRLLY